jgi:hypothetical protein
VERSVNKVNGLGIKEGVKRFRKAVLTQYELLCMGD